ncbi:MAG: CvpA family protein [Prevotellaceae bacterium]|jgi:membrane protein required for colicin V production|nr:CvpA family protein [Prevotellaceae bacterium]
MNIIDIILLIPIGYGVVRGVARGVVKEAASLLNVLLGIYCACYFADTVATLLTACFEMQHSSAMIVAYIVLFLLVCIVLSTIASLLTSLLKTIKLNWANRCMGLLFGGIKWLLITSLILNLFALVNRHLPLITEQDMAQSKLYRPIERTLPTILPFFSYDKFKEIMQSSAPNS